MRATRPNPLNTPRSPRAARLEWSSVPVFGNSLAGLAGAGLDCSQWVRKISRVPYSEGEKARVERDYSGVYT